MEHKKIVLGHGSGGRLSHELINEIFAPNFSNPALDAMDDSAELGPVAGRLAFTTDSYVVTPLEFPGGDIGRLAVCGTVNDLAMKGSVPKWISCSFIIEEGLEIELLERIIGSMKKAAEEAGVLIVTGDTKVVERGKADKIFINTSGIGIIPEEVNISSAYAQPGDVIIVSGRLAEHGITVMNARNVLGLSGDIKSDAAPLNGMVKDILETVPDIHVMRDLTRGGLATALNEIAQASGCDIEINDNDIPVADNIRAACGMIGLDPIYVANEGKAVIFVPERNAGKVLTRMQAHKYGTHASIIGKVVKGYGRVTMNTAIGGLRIVPMLEGEQLPRIC